MFVQMNEPDMITEEDVQSVIHRRPENMHKGQCGRVLIIAGGNGMPGAAVLAAKAALRAGSGLVYVCTPKSSFSVVQTLVPEAITVEWDEACSVMDGGMGRGASDISYDAIAFGPGMGTFAASRRRLKTVLLTAQTPLVLDADGLNLLSADEDLRNMAASYTEEIIMTPHPGEAKRMLETREGAAAPSDRNEMAFDLVRDYGRTIVLKGSGTLVARYAPGPEGEGVELRRNPTGNPGMATAGSGDVLTGVIASFLGQGMDTWDAACAGVFIHGLAGDIARTEKGERGLIAGDLVQSLPYALRRFENLDEMR